MKTVQNNKRELNLFAIKYGAILGAAIIAVQLLFYMVSGKINSSDGYAGNACFAITIVSLFYFSRQYRNCFLPDFFPYGTAFKIAFRIGFYSAVIIALFYYVFYKLNPQTLAPMLLEIQRAYEKANMSEDQIEVMINLIQMLSPGIVVITNFIQIVIETVIIALFVALVNKKNREGGVSPFDRDMNKIEN